MTTLTLKKLEKHGNGNQAINKLLHCSQGTLISLLLGSVATAAYGQATPPDTSEGRRFTLEEVVVTASRRQESLQDVAASIIALSGDMLDQRGVTSFSDLSRSTAGLYLEQTGDITGVSLRVRGVGTRANSPSDPAVGVLVDGIYQARQGAAFSEMLDVARVEVLRGPQGTLFGKNTTSGVIHIHTNDPETDNFSGRIQGVVGNYDNRELRGVVNIPLVEDKLALRVSGFTAERDGYTKNVFLNEDTRNVDRHGWRARLLWNVTDDFTAKLTAESLDQKSRLDQGLVSYGPGGIALLEANGLDPANYPIGLGRAQQSLGSRSFGEVDRYSLHLDWNIPHHSLKSITAYEEVTSFIQNDSDLTVGFASPPSPSGTTNINTTKITTQEFQLSSELDGPFSYLVGAFWQNQDLISNTTLFFGGPDYNLNARPATVMDVDSLAFFGNVTYDFTDALNLSLGVRYTDDEKQGFNVVSGNPADITHYREMTYSAKLSYQFNPDVMFYFSHDKGFKSGGYNQTHLVMQAGEEFNFYDPEIAYNYELGMKSELLDGRLRLNAAAFYQEFEDYHITQSILGLGTVLVTNAAEVETKGVEIDFTYLATDHLTIDGSIAYIRSKYSDYENAPCFQGAARPGCLQDPDSGAWLVDLSGKTLDSAPELTFNVGAEWRAAFASIDGMEWFSRMDLAYRDDTYLDQFLVAESKQDSYWLLNARVGLESFNTGWKATLWANNLTNEKYAIMGEWQVSNAGQILIQGVPRTYGLTVDYSF